MMPTNSKRELSQGTWENLREHFRVSGKALFILRQKLSLPKNGSYVIGVTLGDSLGRIARLPIVSELRSSEPFRSLTNFVNSVPALQIVFLKSSELPVDESDRLKESLDLAVELILLRVVVSLEMEASTGYKTVGQLLDDLMTFLRAHTVPRMVSVPLYNLELATDEMIIEGVGRLRRIRHGPNELAEFISNQSLSALELEFEVSTDHFLGALQYPISQEIGKRIAILRLFYQPLTSFNHFDIHSERPWESPLFDSHFSSRFWADSSKRPTVSSSVVSENPNPQQTLAISRIQNLEWGHNTPWKLAVSRLDDAIFKLNSNSPDAILDLAIGLECLFTESESRQESAHKVAVRAARYLENTLDGRQEVHRQVKQIYGVRSTLAHGKVWRLDSKGLATVELAAKLLVSTLRRMIVQGVTELDLEDLDLG